MLPNMTRRDLESLWRQFGHLSSKYSGFSVDAALVTGHSLADARAAVPGVESECAFS